MKKKISLILSFLMAASLMAGCKTTDGFPADTAAANASYEYENTYDYSLDETVILSEVVSVNNAAAKKSWNETELSETLYVSKACSSRKTPSKSAAAVKKYSVGTIITIVAATDTGFYKLKDGTFIPADSVTDEPPAKTTTAKKTTTSSKKTTTKKTTTAQAVTLDSKHPVDYTDRYPYQQLTKDEKTLYKNIVNAAYNFESMAELPSGMSSTSIFRVYKIIYDNEPQLFWLSNAVPKPLGGNLTIYYDIRKSQAESYQASIDAKRNSVMKAVKSCKTTVSKIKYIYDWVAKNNIYGTEYGSTSVINGIGGNGGLQCQGYTRTVQYLMDYAGIECMTVSGKNDEGTSHSWNIVYCEDGYYALDATWGDAIQTYGNKNYVKYVYFLANDDVMDVSHHDKGTSLTVKGNPSSMITIYDPPACTNTSCYYYNVYNKKASGVKEAKQAILDEIDAAIAENRNVVEIQVESKKTWTTLTSDSYAKEFLKYAKSKSKNVTGMQRQKKRAEDALVVQYDIVYKK